MYCKISKQLNKSTLYVFSFSNESKSSFSLMHRRKQMVNCEQVEEFPKSRRATYYKTSKGQLILLRKNTIADSLPNTNNSLVKYIRLRRKLICMLIIVVGAFYVCLFPLKIWNLLFMFFGHKKWFMDIVTLRVYWSVSITVRTLFYINSSLNPILYNWLSAKFRYNFKKLLLFSKIQKKSKMSPIVCK